MSTEYAEALDLRGIFKTLQGRAKRLRKTNPSMEQAQHLLELIGVGAGVQMGSPAVSVESLETPEAVIDKAEANINKVLVTLEWFFKGKKAEKEDRKVATTPNIQDIKKLMDTGYANQTWVNKATLSEKSVFLTGKTGGALTIDGKVPSAEELIKHLETQIKNIDRFSKEALPVYTKWAKWSKEINDGVEAEWDKYEATEHSDNPHDIEPAITALLRKLHPKQPPNLSQKFDPRKILTMGWDKKVNPLDTRSGYSGFIAQPAIPDVKVEFPPITQETALKLGNLVLKLIESADDLAALEIDMIDVYFPPGFDDYPYRSDLVSDAIDAFGWSKANWDGHSVDADAHITTLLELVVLKQCQAIHQWLHHAVTDQP